MASATGCQTRKDPGEFRNPGRFRAGAEVAAERVVGEILSNEMTQPEGVDDGPLAVGDPELLTSLERHLEAPEVEPRGAKDVDPRRGVVDGRPMRPLRDGQVHGGRESPSHRAR